MGRLRLAGEEAGNGGVPVLLMKGDLPFGSS